jgi:transposase
MGTRKIAKKLGLSRNTVKNALKSEDAPEYKRETYINPELETFHDFIIEKYFVNKLKGSRVLNELRSKGCKVSSSAFYRYIQQYKPEFTRSFMRYETKPGEQGQFDWSPYTVMIHVVPILVPSSEEINIIIVSCRPNQPHICQINRAPMTIPSF